MLRRIALLSSIALIACSAASAVAGAKPADDACNSTSPNASLCLGAQKLAEAGAAVCRSTAAPNDSCALTPFGHDVLTAQLAAYQSSWVHHTAEFQYALGNSVPLGDTLFLGTHNSFNTDSNGVTLSHTDNNQQLTLTQQLDGDMRALELDVHLVNGPENGLGSRVVRVCHGRGASEQHVGCTNEPLLIDVLPEVDTWIKAHPDQVILLYLEDNLGDAVGYDQTIAALDAVLGKAIYRPNPAQIGSSGCANLPLDASRDDVRAAGANVVLVGNCRSGWSADVFGWDANHVESGSTPNYRAYPGCDASYNPGVYATKFVRYYEDSTWLSAAVSPGESPAAHAADSLTPAKVSAMVACGVNLFGFDQFDPNDGRVAGSIWSWADGQPSAAAGACAVQRADGRWGSADCATTRPAACLTATGSWTLSAPATAAQAAAACAQAGATFAAPRTGLQNAQLRDVAGGADVLLGLA